MSGDSPSAVPGAAPAASGRSVNFADAPAGGGGRQAPLLQRLSSSFSGLRFSMGGERRRGGSGSGGGGGAGGDDDLRRGSNYSTRAESPGWSGIFGGGLFGTAAGPRTVVARADSFTGPPRRQVPFNLENDDAESMESAMWGKGAFGCLYSWWRSGPRAVHGAVRRGPEAQHTTNGNFTFPIHAVRLGDSVTFLPTPLRNWWGRPRLQVTWLVTSIYLILVMAGKLGIFYFLSTSLIIFPTALGGGLLGTFGAIRYLRNRTHIDSFDTAAAVEFTKLQSLLAAMLTLLSMVAYIALQLAWSLRQLDCDGKSITECSARDMCENWSPCYAKPPLWLTAELDIILGAIVLTAGIPYLIVSVMVFRRARAASYYLVDNML